MPAESASARVHGVFLGTRHAHRLHNAANGTAARLPFRIAASILRRHHPYLYLATRLGHTYCNRVPAHDQGGCVFFGVDVFIYRLMWML